MMTKLTWLGHGSWLIEASDHRVLLDPFLTDNPSAKMNPQNLDPIGHILISHGHFDHVADAAAIANRNGATIVAIFEIAQWFAENHGVKNITGMNVGGSLVLPFGSIKMTQAIHSSQLPDGSYGGVAGGFLIMIDGKTIYFACDTALYSDMRLLGEKGIDVAILPIGDLFTMGPKDSVTATNYLNPKQVLPMHYNTWPPIEQDAAAWANMVKAGSTAEPIVLEPGQSHFVD